MEIKDVQLQSKAELISTFCCSSSCRRPAELFNLCAEPRARCWSELWRLLLSGELEVWYKGQYLAEEDPLATLGGSLANTLKNVWEMTVNSKSSNFTAQVKKARNLSQIFNRTCFHVTLRIVSPYILFKVNPDVANVYTKKTKTPRKRKETTTIGV